MLIRFSDTCITGPTEVGIPGHNCLMQRAPVMFTIIQLPLKHLIAQSQPLWYYCQSLILLFIMLFCNVRCLYSVISIHAALSFFFYVLLYLLATTQWLCLAARFGLTIFQSRFVNKERDNSCVISLIIWPTIPMWMLVRPSVEPSVSTNSIMKSIVTVAFGLCLVNELSEAMYAFRKCWYVTCFARVGTLAVSLRKNNWRPVTPFTDIY